MWRLCLSNGDMNLDVKGQMSARAKRRDAPAHFLGYLSAIRSFISKRVHSNDVDDMVQDVALRMHQRAASNEIANVEGYVFQVARSVMADYGRRDQSRSASLHDGLDDHNHPVERRSPDRIVEERQRLSQTMDVLRQLPSRSRQAFILHRFDELSYADIATHMGISVSAVEKNIMRAIRQLAAYQSL